MLRLRDIRKGFLQHDGSVHEVLLGVSLDVSAGEIVGLTGANGSGKTTLLNVISGELKPDSGSVELDGACLDRMPAHQRYRLIGRVHQESYKALAADLTVEEILSIASRRNRRLRLAAPDAEEALSLLATYSPRVSDFLRLRRRVLSKQLSGGQRQLLSLAAAIVGGPRLLLLDEHLASLDAAFVEVADQFLLSARAKGTTKMIAVSHDQVWLRRFCDRVTTLAGGTLVCFPDSSAR